MDDDRIMVCVRMLRSGVALIDEMAQAEKLDRSEMIRTLLAEAIGARWKKEKR